VLLAIDPELGHAIGLLWQTLWTLEAKAKATEDETPTQ
jgi:hypothetical protein